MLSRLLLFTLLLFSTKINAQQYLLPNEEVIFSFETTKGKQVMLAKDKNDRYIIYRFGTKDKIEFEYPEKNAGSWPRFSYSSYHRGGGIQNEGMDLTYIYFINQDFQYVIYDTYFARSNEISIGIKVIDLKTGKITKIPGLFKTKVGTMNTLQDNEKITPGEELFD